jgi:hypothetical protein
VSGKLIVAEADEMAELRRLQAADFVGQGAEYRSRIAPASRTCA